MKFTFAILFVDQALASKAYRVSRPIGSKQRYSPTDIRSYWGVSPRVSRRTPFEEYHDSLVTLNKRTRREDELIVPYISQEAEMELISAEEAVDLIQEEESRALAVATRMAQEAVDRSVRAAEEEAARVAHEIAMAEQAAREAREIVMAAEAQAARVAHEIAQQAEAQAARVQEGFGVSATLRLLTKGAARLINGAVQYMTQTDKEKNIRDALLMFQKQYMQNRRSFDIEFPFLKHVDYSQMVNRVQTVLGPVMDFDFINLIENALTTHIIESTFIDNHIGEQLYQVLQGVELILASWLYIKLESVDFDHHDSIQKIITKLFPQHMQSHQVNWNEVLRARAMEAFRIAINTQYSEPIMF